MSSLARQLALHQEVRDLFGALALGEAIDYREPEIAQRGAIPTTRQRVPRFASRQGSGRRKRVYTCSDCGNPASRGAKRCRRCVLAAGVARKHGQLAAVKAWREQGRPCAGCGESTSSPKWCASCFAARSRLGCGYEKPIASRRCETCGAHVPGRGKWKHCEKHRPDPVLYHRQASHAHYHRKRLAGKAPCVDCGGVIEVRMFDRCRACAKRRRTAARREIARRWYRKQAGIPDAPEHPCLGCGAPLKDWIRKRCPPCVVEEHRRVSRDYVRRKREGRAA